MKKIILAILTLLFGAITYFNNSSLQQKFNQYFYYSACNKPLGVKIGSLDPHFNLTDAQVIDDINQALQIWNSASGQKLLEYDSTSSLPINFIYDQRQTLIDQSKGIQNQIGNLQNTLNNQVSSLKEQKNSLDPQYQQILKDSLDLKQKMDQFNKDVQYWNSQGGAPPEQYQKLLQEQQALKIQADNLNEKISNFQQLAKNYNSQVGQYQLQADQFNLEVNQLNSLSNNIAQTINQKPEEGIYTLEQNSQKIDIYFIVNQKELIHTLAHEMGHALGLQHNSNKNSIMYPYTTSSLQVSSQDLKDLSEICRRKNIFEFELQRLNATFSYFNHLLSSSLFDL